MQYKLTKALTRHHRTQLLFTEVWNQHGGPGAHAVTCRGETWKRARKTRWVTGRDCKSYRPTEWHRSRFQFNISAQSPSTCAAYVLNSVLARWRSPAKSILNIYTVEPEFCNHPICHGKVAVKERWSLRQVFIWHHQNRSVDLHAIYFTQKWVIT